jgi:hypothetical protein
MSHLGAWSHSFQFDQFDQTGQNIFFKRLSKSNLFKIKLSQTLESRWASYKRGPPQPSLRATLTIESLQATSTRGAHVDVREAAASSKEKCAFPV